MLQHPSGNQMLDDLERAYKMRQDVERCDDLESEERAILNLAAQEYDALKVLSTIPENSELYKYKFEQFKKLSDTRAKAEIFLQEQRLKRLDKNFDFQKKEIVRRFKHDSWMEEQKRRMYMLKLTDLGDNKAFLERPFSEMKDVPEQEAPEPNILASVDYEVQHQPSHRTKPPS